MLWTPRMVRDQLPDVRVRLRNGRVKTGRVYGRKLPAAVLDVRLDSGDVLTLSYSWSALAQSFHAAVRHPETMKMAGVDLNRHSAADPIFRAV